MKSFSTLFNSSKKKKLYTLYLFFFSTFFLTLKKIMEGESLTVQIRSPSMSETLTLTTQRHASVHALKQLIHTVHPKKPTPSDQRIIFAGKLLNDTDALSRILEKTDVNSVPTFHLVVKPSPVVTSSSTNNNNTTTTSSSSPYMNTRPNVPSPLSNAMSATATASSSVPPPTNTTSQNESTTLPGTSQSSFTTFQQQQQQMMPGYPSLLPGGYQVIALNGQYYLAPVLVPAIAPQLQQQQQSLFHPTFQPQGGYTPQPHFQQQQPQVQQAQPMPQQQQGRGGIRAPVFIHAQNRVQRATSVWLALKLIFILFILCQDASLERILFFHVLAFIFFLYQTGRLRFVIQRVRPEDLNRPHPPFHPPQQQQQQQQQQGPSQPQQNQPPVSPPATHNNNNNNNAAAAASTDSSAPSTPQLDNTNEQASSPSTSTTTAGNIPQQRQQPTTLLGTLKRGAYTFIASLWPNYGHDARIAQALDNGQNEAWENM
ncbi:hypothetical protein BDA99DRAFT_492628 [Phascolomyces articulosus]|uniref:Ubiquitin-like domain-containing protein n=1 Tax=Phascolomyces articulosus TaxID=60185 RepID=A0AAD5PJD0_9FUNG|nr:hypothetical protein BDA99DRAFT_492628 [Phascolomyces articulosus]